MFATIINDAYKKEEKLEVAKALDDICSPRDAYGWASDGIYCYWDYYTKEIYYIGLAVDLRERFKQHNGLVIAKGSSTKKEYIDKYFEEKEILGFSVFLQSPLSQPFIKYKNKHSVFKDDKGLDRENHKHVEGILLEAYRMNHNRLPIWNKNHGSKEGQRRAKPGNYSIIEGFTATKFHPLVSRSSLRDLSANLKYYSYENSFLHVLRMGMLLYGMNFKNALEHAKFCDSPDRFEEMMKEHYLLKDLVLRQPKDMILITERPSNISEDFTTFNFKLYKFE